MSVVVYNLSNSNLKTVTEYMPDWEHQAKSQGNLLKFDIYVLFY